MARLLSGSGTVTGTGALTSIAPGADGQVLTSTGTVWNSEAAAGGGKVLQCLSTYYDTTVSTTSTTMVDNGGLNQAITTAHASNKVLVLAHVSGIFTDASGTQLRVSLFRTGATGASGVYADGNLAYDSGSYSADMYFCVYRYDDTGGGLISGTTSIMFLDDPDTAAELTYQVKFCTTSSAVWCQHQYSTSTITCMELDFS